MPKGKYDKKKSLMENVDMNTDMSAEDIFAELQDLQNNQAVSGPLSPASLPRDWEDLKNPQTLKVIQDIVAQNKKNKTTMSEQAKASSDPFPQDYLNNLLKQGVNTVAAAAGGAMGGGWPGAGLGAATTLPGIIDALKGQGKAPDILSGENISNLVGGAASKITPGIGALQSLGKESPILANLLKGGGEAGLANLAGQGVNMAKGEDFSGQDAIMSTLMGGTLNAGVNGMLASGAKNAATPKINKFKTDNPYVSQDINTTLDPVMREAKTADLAIANGRRDIKINTEEEIPKYKRMLSDLEADHTQKLDQLEATPAKVFGGKTGKQKQIDDFKKQSADQQKQLQDYLDDLPNRNTDIENQLYSQYGKSVVDNNKLRREFADPNRLRKFLFTKMDNLGKAGKKGDIGALDQDNAVDGLQKMIKFSADVSGSDRPMQEAITAQFVQALRPAIEGNTRSATQTAARLSPVMEKAVKDLFPNQPEVFKDLMDLSKNVDKLSSILKKKEESINLRTAPGANSKISAWLPDLRSALSPSEIVDRVLQGKSNLNNVNMVVSKVNRLLENKVADGDMIQSTVRGLMNFNHSYGAPERDRQKSDSTAVQKVFMGNQ